MLITNRLFTIVSLLFLVVAFAVAGGPCATGIPIAASPLGPIVTMRKIDPTYWLWSASIQSNDGSVGSMLPTLADSTEIFNTTSAAFDPTGRYLLYTELLGPRGGILRRYDLLTMKVVDLVELDNESERVGLGISVYHNSAVYAVELLPRSWGPAIGYQLRSTDIQTGETTVIKSWGAQTSQYVGGGAVSQNGWVYFVRQKSGRYWQCEIWRMSLATFREELVRPVVDGYSFASEVKVSLDGRFIAFCDWDGLRVRELDVRVSVGTERLVGYFPSLVGYAWGNGGLLYQVTYDPTASMKTYVP